MWFLHDSFIFTRDSCVIHSFLHAVHMWFISPHLCFLFDSFISTSHFWPNHLSWLSWFLLDSFMYDVRMWLSYNSFDFAFDSCVIDLFSHVIPLRLIYFHMLIFIHLFIHMIPTWFVCFHMRFLCDSFIFTRFPHDSFSSGCDSFVTYLFSRVVHLWFLWFVYFLYEPTLIASFSRVIPVRFIVPHMRVLHDSFTFTRFDCLISSSSLEEFLNAMMIHVTNMKQEWDPVWDPVCR